LLEIPAYFFRQPPVETSPATLAGFERLYREYVAPGGGFEIPYDLAAPRWQFLCYLCDHKNILLHGSGERNIAEFEPRQPHDVEEFSNRRAVYAASDGLWPMYFAIVDRQKVSSLINACFQVIAADGVKSEPYYYFSVDQEALAVDPWRAGMIYLLPGATFEPQPLQDIEGVSVEVAQWASLVEVTPLAKLAVTPADFPFLKEVYGHDPVATMEKVRANPKGFPWHE
jgi:hypothetical protein